ncbi:MAG: hypothetical protein Q7V20_23090 [Aquabacterium sp.]|uniref:hypothetical protein n=1 Tax=Aquabacterium sp. TaxID=1872578 RepID=UPI00271FC253|nr:hypothetical protein [Aquabacterium sp.]MDO9006340.1 hypothetical protein [Aquabacterium sp.]
MLSAATTPQPGLAYGVVRHILPERFGSYAAAELGASPLHVTGLCFNPSCGARFDPSRVWQMYCCGACERASTAEMRAWGHRMALPLLAWRMGKYERHDAAVRARTNAARRYISHAQSLWLADRFDQAGGV